MSSPYALDPALAAEVAASALRIVGRRIPHFSPAHLITHLCGALGFILLNAADYEDAVDSLGAWQATMLEVLTALRDHEGLRH